MQGTHTSCVKEVASTLKSSTSDLFVYALDTSGFCTEICRLMFALEYAVRWTTQGLAVSRNLSGHKRAMFHSGHKNIRLEKETSLFYNAVARESYYRLIKNLDYWQVKKLMEVIHHMTVASRMLDSYMQCMSHGCRG
jgi:hypothetical protein